MLVNVAAGTVTLMDQDNVLVTLPYQPLSQPDMILQAQYHLMLRRLGFRRVLMCRECREEMIADTQANEDDQSWEMMARCSCRAIYGKVSLSTVMSAMPT